ncbi:hypothetical protein B8V81_3501 [Paenibacillus pasadenensis]|uniref:Uncharacterized protein n=1 Tax=Paenibacillus pasadenensis TaxID=217090 RepID=A0A2N5N424_9BACL|nr:hypothetical protein B8V81_3501 [Paenibacillus pasadenensis]
MDMTRKGYDLDKNEDDGRSAVRSGRWDRPPCGPPSRRLSLRLRHGP